jgi:PAS domain S-box-containing protein
MPESAKQQPASAPPNVDMAAVPAMVYTYTINHDDGSSNFPYVSEYCEAIFGFTANELMSHPELLMNAVHKDDSQKFTKSVVESMTCMTIWDFQFRMLDKEGNVKFVHGKSKPTLVEETNENGTTQTLTKWSGCLFDITEQEKHNAMASDEMRALMNESMAPIFGIDRNGVVNKWNATISKLTGYSEEEAIGKTLVNFMAEEQRGTITILLGSILRSGEPEAEQECVLLTKELKPLYLFLKCITRHDSNGEIAGVAFCGQDISKVKEEEKKKEAALKLVDAEKGLMEWLSHEVRNPLSIATEAAEALKDDTYYTNNAESASHVDLISESLSYIVDLLTDMLDLNKCIEGKVTLHPKVCNVRDEVLLPTRNMMNMRNKAVQVSVEGGENMTAVVDSLRLRQVMTNLVSNSLKFTSVGFVRIKLKMTIGDTMLLSVSDSGCGISPEYYESLFSKWEQLGSRTNGTGIGLCLCQALIRVMGGHISLNRDYNSGIAGHPVRCRCV